ncbi:MAG: hypothetical protein AAF567_13990 [Actinomycetota bacterium]
MRAGALPKTTPARALERPLERAEGVEGTDDAANEPAQASVDGRLARLELVRPGVTTAATLAHERTLPVAEDLAELTPRGALQRGMTVATHGPGATSLSLALMAEATRQGSFLGIVAPRSFSLAACLDFDIPLRRVVQFILPERTEEGAGWAQLVAAVIEGFDLVLLADRRRVTASQGRQLVTRARERGSVLMRAGGPSWAEAADLRYDLADPAWDGLGRGHGHLQDRTVQVQIAGRRWQGASRRRQLLFSSGSLPRVQMPAEVADRRSAAPITAIGTTGAHAGSDIDRLLAAADRAIADRDERNRRHSPNRHDQDSLAQDSEGQSFGAIA